MTDPNGWVSELVDQEGPGGDLPEPMRAAVAWGLALHGMLLERTLSIEPLIARTLSRVRRVTLFRRLHALAAAGILVAVGITGFMLLTGPGLPDAEAVIDRLQKSASLKGDRHYVTRLLVDNVEQTDRKDDWYFRADRWVVRHVRPSGLAHWIGFHEGRYWWLDARGRVWRPRQAPRVEAALPMGSLPRMLSRLKKDFTLTTVGREKGRIRIRAVRARGTGRYDRVDLLADEKSGALVGGEFHWRTGKNRMVRIMEFVDAKPHPDKFYLPEGH